MIEEIIKLFLIAWVVSSWSLYFSDFIRWKSRRKFIRTLLGFLTFLLSCPKCITFWSIFLLTGDFFGAAGTALLINIYFKIEQKIKTTL